MSNKKGITTQEISEMVKERMKKYELHDIYFTLKAMGLRYIKDSLSKQVQVCLALNDIGLPITSYTITLGFPEKKPSQCTYILHNLGDRQVLTLLRDRKRKDVKGLRWLMNPIFRERFKGKDHVET